MRLRVLVVSFAISTSRYQKLPANSGMGQITPTLPFPILGNPRHRTRKPRILRPLLQFTEMTIPGSLDPRPQTRVQDQAREKTGGDQPEQLHQSHILVSSFGYLYYYCSASVLSLKNFPEKMA